MDDKTKMARCENGTGFSWRETGTTIPMKMQPICLARKETNVMVLLITSSFNDEKF